MTQGEYDHGDTLNFAGLTLAAVTKSGATKNNNKYNTRFSNK